jgi:hypothetical protein
MLATGVRNCISVLNNSVQPVDRSPVGEGSETAREPAPIARSLSVHRYSMAMLSVLTGWGKCQRAPPTRHLRTWMRRRSTIGVRMVHRKRETPARIAHRAPIPRIIATALERACGGGYHLSAH